MFEQVRVLTDRQAEVLAWIDGYIHERGFAPAQADLCRHFGIFKNAFYGRQTGHLTVLERKGFVAFAAGPRSGRAGVNPAGRVARSLRVVRRVDGDRVLIKGAWFRFVPLERLGVTA